ncbi:hypothetical protein GCM10009860_08160 [Microbacterium mitrae]
MERERILFRFAGWVWRRRAAGPQLEAKRKRIRGKRNAPTNKSRNRNAHKTRTRRLSSIRTPHA